VLPVQGAVNAQLHAKLDSALPVGALSFLVATAAMVLVLAAVMAAGTPRPRLAALPSVPWWGWLGGLCGATYVTAVFLLIPEIGAAPVVVLTVAGQQLASIALDRYGLLRLARRPISQRRRAGDAALLVGVVLIAL
jgi:transporter family-2 protein